MESSPDVWSLRLVVCLPECAECQFGLCAPYALSVHSCEPTAGLLELCPELCPPFLGLFGAVTTGIVGR